MNETQALVKTEPQPIQPQDFSAFGSASQFADAQRMARLLGASSIVPDSYRGETNLGNCVIALEIANRIGANVLAVMQNLYIVHGKPAWSSQFLISCVNASRQFTPLRYRMTGEKGTDSWGCVAWAEDKKGEKLESPEITIATAKAEGWFQKNGSKWKTMPELMLRYRTATLFARLYAPELTMGIKTDDEVIDVDVVDIAPVVTETTKRPDFGTAPAIVPAPAATAPTPQPEPKPRKKPQAATNPPVEQPAASSAESFENAAPKAQEAPAGVSTPSAAETPVVASPQQQAAPSNSPGEGEELVNLREAMEASGVNEDQVMAWAKSRKLAKPEQNHLSELATTKLASLYQRWPDIEDAIKAIK